MAFVNLMLGGCDLPISRAKPAKGGEKGLKAAV